MSEVPPHELLRLKQATAYFLEVCRDTESAVEQLADRFALRDPGYRSLLASLRTGCAPDIARDVARLLGAMA